LYFIDKIELIEQISDPNNYKFFFIVSYINKLLSSVIYGQEESKKIFWIVNNFFKNIKKEKTKRFLNILILFRFKLLEALGYKIKPDFCILCGNNKKKTYYSIEKKGFICNKCTNINIVPICEGSKKVISQIDKLDYANINYPEQILNELELIFNETLKIIVTINTFNKLEKEYLILKNGI
jgi:DNA repair protein RecO